MCYVIIRCWTNEDMLEALATWKPYQCGPYEAYLVVPNLYEIWVPVY